MIIILQSHQHNRENGLKIFEILRIFHVEGDSESEDPSAMKSTPYQSKLTLLLISDQNKI